MHDAAIQPTLFSAIERTADFCRRRIYRYTLWRRWYVSQISDLRSQIDPSLRYVNFICLNPSTADENADDPTVRKCSKFAWTWGYDAMCITNLFAYRSTDPRKLYDVADPVGFGNDRHIFNIAQDAALVVCAWGRDGSFMGRGARVREMVRSFDPHYLRITLGQPWHPLYLPDNTRPSRWYSRDFSKENTHV